jgi:Sigma 54 modulation/S30EA ribosomal protein C terminus
MRRTESRSIPEITFEARGPVPEEMTELARERMAAVCRAAPEPVLLARVKLTLSPDPAVARRAVAQGFLDVNGRPVRVQVAAPSMREAISLMHDRLMHRLERVRRHWEAVRGNRPAPGPHEWRHGAEPAHRPDHYPRPASEREVVRHKTFALAAESVDEAAFDMEALDYDFHLFTDVETGQDSVLYRDGKGYRLARVEPDGEPRGPVAVPLTVSPQPAARLTLEEAIQRLEMTRQPFAFFADSATGRGNLLYLRYDGHYGLITPAG